jgi:hypothetical protein
MHGFDYAAAVLNIVTFALRLICKPQAAARPWHISCPWLVACEPRKRCVRSYIWFAAGLKEKKRVVATGEEW